MTDMASYVDRLPQAVQMRAASLGEQGRDWLASLPSVIETLQADWQVEVGEVLAGGSESLVARANNATGEARILKIGMTGSADLAIEARVYGLGAGQGYATLYEHSETHNALLLEALGAPLDQRRLPIQANIRALCELLVIAWQPLAENPGLMTGAEKAVWLAEFITSRWQQLDKPCSKAVIDLALNYTGLRETSFAPEKSVLVHGDAHELNALLVPGTVADYKFVDPDGLFAEPACDLAVPMRGYNEELLTGATNRRARARAKLLGELTGVDPESIWQWGFMERISTGLVLLEIGMREEGEQTLAVAERICNGES